VDRERLEGAAACENQQARACSSCISVFESFLSNINFACKSNQSAESPTSHHCRVSVDARILLVSTRTAQKLFIKDLFDQCWTPCEYRR
jgi:hypothetical protein